jgi:hypothetical protein
MAIQGSTDASSANDNPRIICLVRVGGASLRIRRFHGIEGELSISRVEPFQTWPLSHFSHIVRRVLSTQKFGYASSAPLGVRGPGGRPLQETPRFTAIGTTIIIFARQAEPEQSAEVA